MVGERARITDLTGKRVVLMGPTLAPVGIWRMDEKGIAEKFYVPSFPKGWSVMAETLLNTRGHRPSLVEWIDQLVHDSAGYMVNFSVYDAPDDEPLEATLHRFRDEMFTESIKK